MAAKNVTLKTPYIKLDQLLKFADISGSGGEASYLIAEGLVSVDGIVEIQRGKKIRPGMTVICRIPGKEEMRITVKSSEDR